MKKIFLSIFIFLFSLLALEANAKIQATISISPNPANVNSSVQINISASDSVNSILLIDLYIDGVLKDKKDSYDCAQGTNNPVKTCSTQFTKQFSTKGNYRISGGVLDLNGALTEIPETILTVAEAGAAPPAPTPGGPTIDSLTPNPAHIDSTISISGSNFCSNIDFDLSRITVIFDQTAISGGTTISTPPSPLTSNCSLLKVNVPSSLIPENIAKVFVQNTKGVSDSANLSLQSPSPSGPPPGGTPPSGSMPTGKLEVSWPNSPMGTNLNKDSGLIDLIKYLYDWGISLGGFAAFIALIIAGFQYLTSSGNAGKMSDAMGRIKSAGLGLVLLFSSFLILNTINPQLTKLEEPKLPPSQDENWGSFDFKFLTKTEPCKKVELFEGTNAINPLSSQPPSPIPSAGWELNFGQELKINSIKIEGGCQVTLYQLRDQKMNADYPSVPISGETKDIGGTYGVNKFRSIRVKQIQ